MMFIRTIRTISDQCALTLFNNSINTQISTIDNLQTIKHLQCLTLIHIEGKLIIVDQPILTLVPNLPPEKLLNLLDEVLVTQIPVERHHVELRSPHRRPLADSDLPFVASVPEEVEDPKREAECQVYHGQDLTN